MSAAELLPQTTPSLRVEKVLAQQLRPRIGCDVPCEASPLLSQRQVSCSLVAAAANQLQRRPVNGSQATPSASPAVSPADLVRDLLAAGKAQRFTSFCAMVTPAARVELRRSSRDPLHEIAPVTPICMRSWVPLIRSRVRWATRATRGLELGSPQAPVNHLGMYGIDRSERPHISR